MAPYSRSWDEAAPPGSGAAADIDEFIQHVRQDVRERLAQIVPGWTDEDEDPKRAVIPIGESGDRPASGDAHAGEYYYSLDEDALDLFTGTEWKRIFGGDGGEGSVTPSGILVAEATNGNSIPADSVGAVQAGFSFIRPTDHYIVMYRTQFFTDAPGGQGGTGEWSHWAYGNFYDVGFTIDPSWTRYHVRLSSFSDPSTSRHNRFRIIATVENTHPTTDRFVQARFQLFALPAPADWNLAARTEDPS